MDVMEIKGWHFPPQISKTRNWTSDVCLYPDSPPLAGCDSRSIFKWSTCGLNTEFSFKTCCYCKSKEPSLPVITNKIFHEVKLPTPLPLISNSVVLLLNWFFTKAWVFNLSYYYYTKSKRMKNRLMLSMLIVLKKLKNIECPTIYP